MKFAMGMAAAAALGVAAVAGGAVAKEAANVQSAARDAVVTTALSGEKTLYVCEDTAMTRRAFARQFGQVEFVTAEDVRTGAATWAAPKCITSVEVKRLKAKRVETAGLTLPADFVP